MLVGYKWDTGGGGGRGQLCVVPFFSSFPKIEKHCARGFTHTLFRKMMEKVDVLMVELLLVWQLPTDCMHFRSDALR